MAILLAASVASAQLSGVNTSPNAQATVTLAGLDRPDRNVTHHAATEHAVKIRHDSGRNVEANPATPVVYPVAQGSTVAGREHDGRLNGWVLLLMGAFLIVTISQRRYQALSDI